MKNLPYMGGYCKKKENKLSFKGNLNKLKFETFEEFCKNAEIILNTYIRYKNEISIVEYKKYIYSHKFSNNEKIDIACKDKCFEWIMSYEYDEISINDLYSALGLLKKGKK